MNHATEPTPAVDPVRKLTLRGGRDAAASPEGTASDVGTLLCASRMRLGKDLQEIAALLHIRYTYLVAIEDGRFEDLPGQAYALGFVRAYAEHLGLDGDEVVRRFKDENAGLRRKASLDFPMPAPESGIPSGALLLVAVLTGMVVYGLWYSFAGADRNATALIQEVPARLSALLGSDNAMPTQTEAVTSPATDPVRTPDPVPATPVSADPPLNEDELPPSPTVIAAAIEQPAAPSAVDATPQATAEPVTETLPSLPADSASQSQPTPTETPVVVSPTRAEQATPTAETQVATPAPIQSTPPAPATAPPTTPVVVAAAPTPAAQPTQAPSSEGQPEPRPQASPDSAPASPMAVAAPVQAASVPAPPVAPAATPAAAPPAQPVRPAVSKDVIELRARADSWIQVRSGDQLLLTRLLRKGETYRVPDRSDLTLMTGNAGGLEVLVNGTVLPPLGNEGSVARGVPLDANRLLTMAKAAEPGEPVDAGAD
ncbi:MAG: DUF4115 domain-containing protein [Rhodospirillaceae bacterium]|nr:DUF4115 domain-containing protein [Rhodospirillaceae bacterium]